MKFLPVKVSPITWQLPLFTQPVAAGFPSPADDYLDKPIDLNELLIRHPAATYFVRAKGSSMIEAGILDGALLIVDCGIQPKHNDIVIACLAGEFTVKRYLTRPHPMLRAENSAHPDIQISSEDVIETFGVVRYVINEVQ